MNPYLLTKPVLTEKTVQLAQANNTYSFAVTVRADKNQIKEAVESLYGVDVVSVRTISRKPQFKRTGRRRLFTSTAKTKKALVTLKAGQTIDLFDVGETK